MCGREWHFTSERYHGSVDRLNCRSRPFAYIQYSQAISEAFGRSNPLTPGLVTQPLRTYVIGNTEGNLNINIKAMMQRNAVHKFYLENEGISKCVVRTGLPTALAE